MSLWEAFAPGLFSKSLTAVNHPMDRVLQPEEKVIAARENDA